MKKTLFILCLLFSAISANAQAPSYDDLKILYADGNYEKLIKVAEGYTLKEDLKKDALPFLWLAKGLYKISLSGTSDEKFKNAYKDAIGALGKALKNDKDGSQLEDHMEFVEEFQMSMATMIENDLAAKDYNKASGWVLKYVKVTKNLIGVKYLDGAMKFKKADKSGANTVWKEADALLKNVTSLDSFTEADKIVLMHGILETADCYVTIKQVEKAKTLMKKVSAWFEDNETFKAKYDELF